jgi:capsular exopolysaccharide synthesis family protein
MGLPAAFSRPGDAAHRLEIVRRDGEPAAAPVATPATPQATEAAAANRPTFTASRPASWSPVAAAAQGVAVEQYRRLAGAIIRAQAEHGVKVVMVTSALAGEGKSLTAANLAVTLSRSYQRSTLLIDADQRDPSQHVIFRVDNPRGLTEYMQSYDGGPVHTVELFPGLTLLPAGRPTSDPMGGLTSSRLRQLLADAASTFDVVLVDTPPVTLVPDAGLLAPLVDATVLVIKANDTQYDAVASAVATIGRERILGTVLNQADDSSFGRYGYGYGYGQRSV